MKQFKLNNKKGITIVSLVITIIIIIILAGVTINLLIGENSIIEKSKVTQSVQDVARISEKLELLKAPILIDKHSVDLETYKEKLYDSSEEYKIDYIDNIDSSNAYVVLEGKYKYLLQEDRENGDVKIIYEGVVGELILSETSGTFKYPTPGTFNVTKNASGGALSVSTSNSNIATASINTSTNVVTVTPGTTAGTATITVTSAATTNYEAQTATYTATVRNGTITLDATAYTGTYDGKAHDAVTIVSVTPSDATIKFTLGGVEYVYPSIPQVTGVDTYSVSITASKAGYETLTTTKTVTVKKAIARINDKNYDTLQKAINAVPNNGEETVVTLLENTSENIEILEEAKKIILELNGNEISGCIVNKSTKEVIIKNGSIVNEDDNSINNYGIITITGVTISSQTSYGLYNTGDVQITGGTISSQSLYGLYNFGNVLITDGTIIGESSDAIVNNSNTALLEIEGGNISSKGTGAGIWNVSGTCNISGGTISSVDGKGTANEKAGILTIANGTISSQSGYGLYNLGDAQITGGTISSQSNAGLYNTGDVQITGGTISSQSLYGLYNFGNVLITDGTIIGESSDAIVNNSNTALLEIEGGNISSKGTGKGIWNYSGICNISGGTISSQSGYGLYNAGDAQITGGTISSQSNFGLYNTGDVQITGGTISSQSLYGLYNFGNVLITDGTIIGESSDAIVNNSNTALLEIEGGNISSKGTGVGIWNVSGTCNISGGTISSVGGKGIANESAGTLKINGGIITGKNYAAYNNGGTATYISGTCNPRNF